MDGMYWVDEVTELDQKVDELTEELAVIARHIHWPECWDTMAYPTLADAVCEITMCDPKQCSHPKALSRRAKNT